jgi:hypothetical protein
MEDAREQRGREIAASAKLEQKGPFWIVPSQSGDGTYIVDYNSRWPKCSCPDHETRQVRCKHLFAVEYTLRRVIKVKDAPTITETLKVTYSQNWPAYNAAQTCEKQYVAALFTRSLQRHRQPKPEERTSATPARGCDIRGCYEGLRDHFWPPRDGRYARVRSEGL